MPAPSAAPKIAVIYYSWTGTVYELAKYVAEGAQRAGAEVRLLKVRELAPEEVIAAKVGWAGRPGRLRPDRRGTGRLLGRRSDPRRNWSPGTGAPEPLPS